MTTPPISAALTDVGQKRDHNEDAVLSHHPLYLVADGVGGAEAGEIASQAVTDILSSSLDSITSIDNEAVALAELERAIHEANARILSLQSERGNNMMTTLTAAVIRPDHRALVGHVGDSRAYLIDASGIKQVTDDHSMVAELVRAGDLTEDEAARHPQRNVITRAVGADLSVVVDTHAIDVPEGAWLVLCSDGLTNHVSADEIAAEVIAGGQDAELIASSLVSIANERGGTDNISVVLVQPRPAQLAPPGGWADGVPPQGTGQIRMPDLASDDAPVSTAPADRPPRTRVENHTVLAESGFHVPWWAWLSAAAALAGVVLVLAWSNSYYLVERNNGRVGINQGFPIAGANRPHATGTVNIEDLPASEREALVESTTLRSRENAERLLSQLPEKVDGADQKVVE
jgi:protein phosphatase